MAVIVLIYAGAHWREFSGTFSGRSAQYGSQFREFSIFHKSST